MSCNYAILVLKLTREIVIEIAMFRGNNTVLASFY
jgi:hypothetical protein